MMRNLIIILITALIYGILNNIIILFTNDLFWEKLIELVVLTLSLILLNKYKIFASMISSVEQFLLKRINNKNGVLKNEDDSEIIIKPRVGAIKGLKSRFYGLGYSIKIHDFNLYDPMIYVSDEINLNLGQEIPFLIFRQMHVNPKSQGIIKIDKKRVLSNYMDMTQAERTAFLYWLSRGRTGSVENHSFINLYLKGLAYRFFEESKNKKEIYQEVIRIYQEYGHLTPIVANDCLSLIELFSTDTDVVRYHNLMDWQDLVRNKLKLEFNNEKYYSLMWNIITLKKEALNIENVLWFYLRDPKVAKLIHNQQALECLKQILLEQFEPDSLSTVKLIKVKKEINFKNFIYKHLVMELDPEASSKIKRNVVKVIDELKFFLLSFHNHSFVESYSLLPVKYKKVIHHPLRDNINELYTKSNINTIRDVMYSCGILTPEINYPQSKDIAKILNDNFIAIEPDARSTKKSYELDQKVFLFKQGSNLLCKNLNFLKARLIVDTIYSVSSNVLNNDLKHLILDLTLKLWPDLKNEKERIWSRMILLDELKEEDLRLSLKTDINSEESAAFIAFVSEHKDLFGIKDARLNKIIELFS